MSGALGLKNSFRERVFEPLRNYRDSDKGGREIGLIEFMQTRAINTDGKPVGMLNTSGQPVTWDDIWTDLAMDPARITLDNVLSLSGDVKYLAPEIVRDFILKGFDMDQSYLDLVAGTENVDSLTVTAPWIQYANENPEAIEEAETIPKAKFSWGTKTVSLGKYAKAIELTDELVLSVRLPLLSYFLQKFGIQLSVLLYNSGISTLINGDQSDSSDACAVVGVDNTTSKLTFKDFLRAWIRARRIAMRWDSLVNNENTAWKVLQISEFSAPQGAGGVVTQIDQRNRIIPARMPQFLSESLQDDQAMLFDKSQAMILAVFRPLLVESERIVMRQISGTACSIISGYITIDRAARVILDGDLAYSGNGFPSWMAPLV